MKADRLRSHLQRFAKKLDDYLGEPTEGEQLQANSTQGAIKAIDCLKKLLSSDLEQGPYSGLLEGVPFYGWRALDAARVLGFRWDTPDPVELFLAGIGLNRKELSGMKEATNVKQVVSAMKKAAEREGGLERWSSENGKDLMGESEALLDRFKELDALLAPGFLPCFSQGAEGSFQSINSREKLRMHLGELDGARERVGGLVSSLRHRWKVNKALVLICFPLSGGFDLERLEQLERRFVRLGEIRTEIRYLLDLWSADHDASQEAKRSFSEGFYDSAYWKEESLFVRAWQDIDALFMRRWAEEEAQKFIGRHEDKEAGGNLKWSPELQTELNQLPTCVCEIVLRSSGVKMPGPTFFEKLVIIAIIVFMIWVIYFSDGHPNH